MKLVEQAYNLITATKTKWARARKKQPSNCPLLNNLPPEIIKCISDELSPASRLVFSQTCRALYAILNGYRGSAHFVRAQYLEYLSLVARDIPEKWVCEICTKLHPMLQGDTPAGPYVVYCPFKLRMRLPILGWGFQPHFRILEPYHRHVQLALKCTRLQPTVYKTYLRKMLAPYHNPCLQTHISPVGQPNRIQAQYSAFPRIVENSNGELRYLILSIWRYHGVNLCHKDVGNLEICPHMKFSSNRQHNFLCPNGFLGRILAEGFGLPSGTMSSTATYACPRCSTEIMVAKHQEYVDVCVWKDLGAESSPLDIRWLIHTRNLPSLCSRSGIQSPEYFASQRAGIVRSLYLTGPNWPPIALPKPGPPHGTAVYRNTSSRIGVILRLMSFAIILVTCQREQQLRMF
ncbi:uncharacterized protein F4822DRAFT_365462 [Hypoxylon trugodes]|uniref:uncharacterized protein n=1 Tax=Hypoxylon trugodes TaxID=326681 RepID=UPI00219226B1|nr:uncharacterized protein F4822DRAFT_365462 [Hypoxylon trugodes]KAI1384495.1 hypothetical protein F4822DRAFT_365462 [Hypoxylon trugodes]